jgi:hypothetical protein
MAAPTPVISIDTRQIMKNLSKSLNTQLGKKLDLWAREYNRNQSRGSDIKDMHEDLARGARQAMLESYRAKGFGKKKSYRQNDRGSLKRYSNGAMEDAILAGGAIGTSEGIRLLDTGEMDRIARQWYRLNFGTMASEQAPKTESIKFKNRSTGVKFSFEGFGPSNSGSFRIPYGFFATNHKGSTEGTFDAQKPSISRQGVDAFYVINKENFGDITVRNSKKRPFFKQNKADITGKRFLDAGAVYLNDHYGDALEEVTLKWVNQSKGKLK